MALRQCRWWSCSFPSLFPHDKNAGRRCGGAIPIKAVYGNRAPAKRTLNLDGAKVPFPQEVANAHRPETGSKPTFPIAPATISS
jgi:hypothetical protein